ncbi:sterol desaturase family protein [Thalassotalea agarivorans]|uniref:Sterol desaturase/sphingolipid hydroxylase, fatty acid hydroxylase superfamily n=1 Tax=Thalassotalea agarivorans TaxID=349064 RepID=A0A1I0B2R1_THASX|nr:sterol desaturase family protein [Thalassotalea agarivorans]SET00784.1 Sterol desaturase/sphingolipid hydroxylase, fatty acid hydroxylase superfamily [Thalassotalea agarivorans]
MIDFLHTNFADLISYLDDANKRLYWGYLVSAIVLAVGVYWATHSSRSIKQCFAFIFPKRIYLSASARLDYLLFVVNKLVRAALFPLILITMAPIALHVSGVIEYVFGAPEFIQASPATIMVVFTLLLFLADDFSRFFLHYLMHKVPLLWEFHKVHHSAEVLTPFTVYRSHPLENFLYATRMALAQGFVVGVCYYLFGPTLKMIDIVGANVFIFAFNILGSNLRHSHIWLSFGNKVEGWLISPAQHQIHHSDNPKHFDTNLGTALAIWDRLFGTLIKASDVNNIRFGMGKHSADHSSLWKMYTQPIMASGKLIKRKLSVSTEAKSKAE